MSSASGYRDELVTRLKYLIELRGKSVTGVERELRRSRGWLGDAFRGGKRLPVESVIEVLAHLGVEPADFFAGPTAEERRWGAYPGPGRHGQGAGRAGEVLEGPEAGLAAEVRQLSWTVDQLIRVLAAKGIVGDAEATTLARPESPDQPSRRS